MMSIITLILDVLVLSALPDQGRPVAVVSVMILLFIFTLSFDLARSEILEEFQKPILVGLLLRILLLYFDLYGRNIYLLPNSGVDSEWFYKQGILAADGLNTVHGAFYTMLGRIFSVVGDSRLFVQFILMLFSIIAIIMTARTLVELGVDSETRVSTIYLLSLLPNFAILSSLFLRESVVTMFGAISLFYFVKWIVRAKYFYLIPAIVAVLLGSTFHSGIIGMALGYIVVLIIYNPSQKRAVISIKNVVPTIVIAFTLLYLFNNYSELFFGKMLRLTTADSIDEIANVTSGGGSSYAAYVGNSSSVRNMIVYTPLRLVFFLGSPFIWQIRGISDIIAIVFNASFYLFALFRSVNYLRRKENIRKSVVACILIVGIMTAFIFAWGVTNTGTAIRHRDKMAPLYAVLLALTGGTPFQSSREL